MCLIAIKPANVVLPDYLVKSATLRNPDGFGALWHDGSVLRVRRYTPPYKEAIEDYRKAFKAVLDECYAFEAVIHLRQATHGGISESNTHPFKVVKGLYMVHNGILQGYGTDYMATSNWFDKYREYGHQSEEPGYPEQSDTAEFVDKILTPILSENRGLIHNKAFLSLIEDHIHGNKLAFMDSRGDIEMVPDKSEWVAHKDLILSNTYAWENPADIVEYKNPLNGRKGKKGKKGKKGISRFADRIGGALMPSTDRQYNTGWDAIFGGVSDGIAPEAGEPGWNSLFERWENEENKYESEVYPDYGQDARSGFARDSKGISVQVGGKVVSKKG